VREHASRYLESQVLTAGREQLLILTYDGLLRFLQRARLAIRQRDYEAKHAGLSRAQALLLELHRTLDFQASPDLARSLAALYTYMLEELARADALDDESRVAHAIELLSTLRSAWAEAAASAQRGASGKESL